jgi:hypothetical protein
MLRRHLAKLGAADLRQPYHLHAPVGIGCPPVEMTRFDEALDQAGDIAVGTIIRFETSDSVMPSAPCRAGPSDRSAAA